MKVHMKIINKIIENHLQPNQKELSLSVQDTTHIILLNERFSILISK